MAAFKAGSMKPLPMGLQQAKEQKPDGIGGEISAHMHHPGRIDIVVFFIQPVKEQAGCKKTGNEQDK